MVFSKPEGVGCIVPSAARALLHARGFTKYHRSRWTQSLACLWYGQYTDMFTCISTYNILLKKSDSTVFSCTDVYRGYMYSCKKTCRFTIEKRG